MSNFCRGFESEVIVYLPTVQSDGAISLSHAFMFAGYISHKPLDYDTIKHNVYTKTDMMRCDSRYLLNEGKIGKILVHEENFKCSFDPVMLLYQPFQVTPYKVRIRIFLFTTKHRKINAEESLPWLPLGFPFQFRSHDLYRYNHLLMLKKTWLSRHMKKHVFAELMEKIWHPRNMKRFRDLDPDLDLGSDVDNE